ncbi:Cof-type HAD-IIB family hydrolase [Oceanobacillus sp. M60]|uniref:Cof-type HAD-IIB family hydrolase n=1 Tax=Oceanobacillus TaxID=182709 RepID=UPI002116B40B|nr:Cof-type HAD-IIB family hydrolase [Oceanobacillus oncorhynchi]UUI38503.1 Cof-type HAD-IIB family hydrolase [Oceanobacillus oncorhynchi]
MIKAIAVDMDGTFLDSSSNYDRKRFDGIFQQLQENEIKFIVASGNQYAQLTSFFKGKEDNIYFVAENGAIIYDSPKLETIDSFPNEFVQKAVDYLIHSIDKAAFILCGLHSAYILKSADNDFKKFAKHYYHQLKEVEHFDSLPNDTFVKFALNVEVNQTSHIVYQLNQAFQGEMQAVSSGHGSIDMIIPGVNKGNGLNILLDRWNISPHELLAFGDANNDLEMLALTEHSYAMETCSPEVQKTAKHRAPSNDESGVLQIIETYLN